MATARWFFQREPSSKFVIQEHLRQGYWRAGPGKLWVDAVQVTPPYKAVGYWHDVTFELEWVPLDYLLLRSNRREEELIRATNLQLGFKPSKEYEENGKHVTEWRMRRVEDPPPAQLGATPVINTHDLS
ncbi:MAG: hypothetical protein M3220_10685 [Chloroflexota bacterium]|nr:hypothetical protein [Chloroflexota bacterium]